MCGCLHLVLCAHWRPLVPATTNPRLGAWCEISAHQAGTLPRERFHLPQGTSVGRRFVNMVVVANLGKCVGAGTCSCAQIGAHLCFLFFFYVAPRWQSTLPEARAELERLGFLLPPSEE